MLTSKHHFLENTAVSSILNDCPLNPFRIHLSQFAVHHKSILNTLLAWSASHRSLVQCLPEPTNRIALWMDYVFPDLRRTLSDPDGKSSDATFAKVIILTSLAIKSPILFGVGPLKFHLKYAREMIHTQRVLNPKRAHTLSSFLLTWFLYLDIFARLSGDEAEYCSSDSMPFRELEKIDDYQVGCILGLSIGCLHILAKIAAISRICDDHRIDPDRMVRPLWRPSEDIADRAAKLQIELEKSRLHPIKFCIHREESVFGNPELMVTNEAFHWAGSLYIHRRILGKPPSHPDVQNDICEIYRTLKRWKGSRVDPFVMFPLFVARCDTIDSNQRLNVVSRLTAMERRGMKRVRYYFLPFGLTFICLNCCRLVKHVKS